MAEPGITPRADYEGPPLTRASLARSPLEQFRLWFAEAVASGVSQPEAMTLATFHPARGPSARIVLLRSLDGDGFVFYTNRHSDKARDIASDPRVALVFHWEPIWRQVRIRGEAAPVEAALSAAYFATRSRESQLGAWASHQSEPISSRLQLDAALEECRQHFGDDAIPCPPHWGGYRVTPTVVEFWQGRPHRLHDRFRYSASAKGWTIVRLQP